MSLWAVVPIKPLQQGKSRLSGVLSPEERSGLNVSLLEQTLRTLQKIPEIDRILVVSRDAAALGRAHALGVSTFQENGEPGLNEALHAATSYIQAHDGQGILILPADLPLLQAEDIRAILACGSVPPVMVISPDRHKQGTNALMINPAGMIPYTFGENSFQKHCALAVDAGISVKVCELPSVALDLDLPEDLFIFQQMGIGGLIF